MWMLSLMAYLLGAIVVILLIAIILAMIAFMIFIIGCAVEYFQDKEDGFFHKIAKKIDW